MLIIDVKDGESIERALKRYKKKHYNVRLLKQLRDRRYYTKPSIERRHEIISAEYRNEKFGDS